MKNYNAACVILAAGQGTRMKSSLPKVLHAIAGRSMLGHVLVSAATALQPERVALVIAPGMEAVAEAAQEASRSLQLCVQSPAQGTGDAVKQALPALEGFEGIVFVLYGDTPLIEPATLQRMIQPDAAITVLGMRAADPGAYGRLITAEDGALERIVEAKDASPQELVVNLCNSGVMAIQSQHLARWIGQLRNDNAKGEYYLTDIVAMARSEGLRCAVIEAAEEELQGVNDRAQLAEAEAVMQRRLRLRAMQNGVTLTDPASVIFSHDTELAADVTVEPHVVFGLGVKVESGARIRAFSHLEKATVGQGAIVGPYARLRPGAQIGANAHIGNFVEIKQAVVETGAKVNHLSYIGDAHIGQYANIGAGTITCNYDGYAKHQTIVGEHAFIGSNTALVAPVEVGAGAMVGAGSTITEDVEPNSLSLTRAPQILRPGWAKNFRAKKQH